ncbi:MAG: Heme chaperone HemW [Chlamydiae bacterium]|nr:Heme chaperone HemW [Chlamydiota bacterium]
MYKDQLLHSLLLEINLRRPQLEDSNICSIYFGGGTPALVGPEYIERLLKELSSIVSIENIEITLELNPENQSLELLQGYRKAGINRLSLGVQSFDNDLLKKLSRTHTAKDVDLAINHSFEAGFENISIDLMYDLPTQTVADWQNTLERAISYPIEHLSLYNLSIEKETVFYKHREKITEQMPQGELSLTLFEMACNLLKEGGFTPYEISAFCRKGAYSRHNTGYWLQRPHLGFGPSAFSLFPPNRFQNVKNLKKYSELLKEDQLPTDFTETLCKEAFLRESFALNLRLYQGLSLPEFTNRFGSLSSELKETLKRLEKIGWITKKDQRIFLTESGRLYHDSVASELVY